MNRFHRALLVAGLFLLAMTQSDDESVFQWRERWRIKSAMRVKRVGLCPLKCCFLSIFREWERQT